MKKIIWRIILLLVIAGLGYSVGVLHALTIWTPGALTVETDFDLGANYFFQVGSHPSSEQYWQETVYMLLCARAVLPTSKSIQLCPWRH